MPGAQPQQVVDWWGNEEPPDAQGVEMVEELLAAHPLLTMREALTEVRIWHVREEAACVPARRRSAA